MPWATRKYLPLCFGLFAAVFGTAHAVPTYTVTDLGVLGTHAEGQPLGVNNAGQVTGGIAAPTGDVHAFLFSNGQMQNIGKPGEVFSQGVGINNNGAVAVDSTSGAFIYNNGVRTNIGPVSSTTNAPQPLAINNNGQVTGTIGTGPTSSITFLYSNGVTRDIGTLGGANSYGSGINDLGQVTGASQIIIGVGTYHAFLYNNGAMRDIGTLGGADSSASAINNSGQIIGNSRTASGGQHAFLYANGTMTDIGDFSARDINDAGEIVGLGPNNHAVLFSDGFLTDLSTLPSVHAAGWDFLLQANAISNTGEIVGIGQIHGENLHGFLLTPAGEAPEPPELALMAAGGLALLMLRRAPSIRQSL